MLSIYQVGVGMRAHAINKLGSRTHTINQLGSRTHTINQLGIRTNTFLSSQEHINRVFIIQGVPIDIAIKRRIRNRLCKE